jgi:hypothetical protein
MHARIGRLILLPALLGLLLPLGCSSEPGAGGGGGDCTISGGNEANPGYPFNLDQFESTIIPALATNCSASCHDPGGSGEAKFKTWATTAEKGNCDFVNTFEAVKAASDTTTPAASRLYASKDTVPDHASVAAESWAALLAFVTDANATCVADGGCVAGVITYFDKDTFTSTIQPALDAAGCANPGCHQQPNGTNGFNLYTSPTAQEEIDANFDSVTDAKWINLTGAPESADLYIQSGNGHGLQTAVFAADASAALLKWITDAKTAADAAGGSGTPPPSCSDSTLLNKFDFSGEILPMLRGEIDFNNPQNEQIVTGCARNLGGAAGACHDISRGPGKFDLVGTEDEALQKFACFIDLKSPSNSPVLLCPSGAGGCPAPGGVHPGGRLFVDPFDINYQKLASFLFAAVQGRTPIDFGQYARTVDVLFNDEAACDDEQANRKCADNVACHGVNGANQRPPNLSDFGIIPEASDVATLRTNFAASQAFVNFLVPESSSMFLYPTDEISNVNNQFATGLEHGGGQCFAVDSVEADTVLGWAQGLRPDGNGFLTAWLIGGQFSTQDADQEFLIDEAGARFSIFDPSGGEQLGQEFDFFQSDVQENDIGAVFDAEGGAVGQGRTGYAIAYLINTTGTDQLLQLNIQTQNDITVFFNGQQSSSPDGGGNVSVTATIPAYSPDEPVPSIVLRIFQAQNQAAMAFTAQLLDEDDVPIDGVNTADVVEVTGGAEGGF